MGNVHHVQLDKYISRIEYLKSTCRGKQVFHLGCSSGQFLQDRLERGDFLHAILAIEADGIVGLDIDEQSIEQLKKIGIENLLVGDVEKLEEVDLDKPFDVVVAGDILEHITRPGAMLDGVKRFLGDNGHLVISTNNAFGLHYQIKRWLGRYSEHFEHVCFYSPETLKHLLERHGYEVMEMYGAFTVPPSSVKQKILFSLGSPLFKLFPVLAGTLVVAGKPKVRD